MALNLLGALLLGIGGDSSNGSSGNNQSSDDDSSSDGLTCSKGHPLKPMSQSELKAENWAYIGGSGCDICKNMFNGTSYHCTRCRFDMCQSCANKRMQQYRGRAAAKQQQQQAQQQQARPQTQAQSRPPQQQMPPQQGQPMMVPQQYYQPQPGQPGPYMPMPQYGYPPGAQPMMVPAPQQQGQRAPSAKPAGPAMPKAANTAMCLLEHNGQKMMIKVPTKSMAVALASVCAQVNAKPSECKLEVYDDEFQTFATLTDITLLPNKARIRIGEQRPGSARPSSAKATQAAASAKPVRQSSVSAVDLVRFAAGSKIALVIGNSNYPKDDWGQLRNPENDANSVAGVLTALNFNVFKGLNAARADFASKLHSAVDAVVHAQKPALVVFFFAGHGVQEKGESFLVNIDTLGDKNPRDICYSPGEIMQKFWDAGASVVVSIIDACRENNQEKRFRGIKKKEDPPPVNVKGGRGAIMYATSSGSLAADGAGSHGAFTEALLSAFEQSEDIEALFRCTNKRLESIAEGQIPNISSNLADRVSFR